MVIFWLLYVSNQFDLRIIGHLAEPLSKCYLYSPSVLFRSDSSRWRQRLPYSKERYRSNRTMVEHGSERSEEQRICIAIFVPVYLKRTFSSSIHLSRKLHKDHVRCMDDPWRFSGHLRPSTIVKGTFAPGSSLLLYSDRLSIKTKITRGADWQLRLNFKYLRNEDKPIK